MVDGVRNRISFTRGGTGDPRIVISTSFFLFLSGEYRSKREGGK